MQQVTGIAEKTRSTYVSSLERLEANVPDKRGLVGILLAPERAYQTLQQRELSLQTRRAYMAAAVSVFKHVPEKVLRPLLMLMPMSTKTKSNNKDALEDLRSRWIVLLRRQTEDAFSKYGTMNASKHQRENYIPWDEWIRVRDATLVKARSAPLGDVAICDAALLLAMLTYIPPVRADFNMVRIVRENDTEKAKNRIVVAQDGSMKLVLTEFKTAGPKFERIESPFPSELTKVVEWALAKRRTLWTTPGPRADRVASASASASKSIQPWTWLFVSPVSGMPYENADVASGHMRSLLRLAFGGSKLVGFNLARHAFINSLDFNKLSPNDLKSIAARMGHSIDQQQQYRLRITPT